MYYLYYINTNGECFDFRDFPESEFDLTMLTAYAREAVRYRCAHKIAIKRNGKTERQIKA